MARGRQRIRHRGSRQQWAQARDLKADGAEAPSEQPTEPATPVKAFTAADAVMSTRCGLCGLVVEQKLRDGRRVVLLPHVLCLSCDEVRCSGCWDAPDDACGPDDEHEFADVVQPEEPAGGV